MATSSQQASERPGDAPISIHDPAMLRRNPSESPQNQSAFLHRPLKRRRLNQPKPSPGSQTSASRWFDNVNQNVKHDMQSNSDIDGEHVCSLESPRLTLYTDELPFYLHPQVYDPAPAQMSNDPSFGNVPARVTKEDSENQDLRSVIDDLTIENKRLRQILRERRGPYNSELDRDKIFEVRTCGLSPEKKRELEAILQNFASTISAVSLKPSKAPANDSALRTSSSALPERIFQKAVPCSRTDSAYASMSNSGLTSAGEPSKTNAEMQRMRGSKNKNVKSYLHDITDSPLPRHSPIMSETTKMRLVIKKLEQLFTGKNAAPSEHSQPLQQQKLSESAANADRHDSQLLNRFVRPEGAREAHIVPFNAKAELDLRKVNGWYRQTLGPTSKSEKSSDGLSAAGNRSPDQRPTRPLDLDINRAQVAEENIEYIRHLGQPSPTRRRDPGHPDHGWVYLNLLINMAQLHTINVTPAFVRKSIAHLSTKFELSKDARKIRWKGGSNGAELLYDNDSGADVTTESSPELIAESMTSKLAKDNTSLDNLASTGSSLAWGSRPLKSLSSEKNHFTESTGLSLQLSNATDKSESGSAFDYKPLFSKDRVMLQDTAFYDDSNNITSAHGGFDNATGQNLSTQANVVSHNHSGRSEDDGLIIYYNNPLFYCDMSGDRQAYKRITKTALSASKHILGVSVCEALSDEEQHKRSLIYAQDTFHHDFSDDKLPSIELAPLSVIIDNQSNLPELCVSGIGGVLPDDHFMLRVQRKHQRTLTRKGHLGARSRANHLRPIMEEAIVSTTRVDLPASRLPPPSYVFFSLSSGSSAGLESGESWSDDADDSEVESFDKVHLTRPTSLKSFSTDNLLQLCATDEDNEEANSCGSNDRLDAAESLTDSDQDVESDRADILYRPLEVITRSLAATVGAGGAASVATQRSAASNRDQKLEQER